MIKAIIFDIGNVICTFNKNLFITKISKYTNKSTQELTVLYKESNLLTLYETDIISPDIFFERMTELCNLKISKEVFIEAFTNIFSPITSTIELVKKLKKNYRLGLLSNVNEWNFEYLIKHFNIFNSFEVISLSYKVKAMKPNAKIYKDCLKKLNLKPRECIYIDDIKKYSDKATELGMFGIHYTSHNQLLKSLKSFGVKV